MCLQKGEGTADGKRQLLQAAKLLIPLAERGHPWAQFALATALLKGEGVKINEEEAMNLFKICAKNGVAPALYNIGHMYAEGKGVEEPDEDEALEWYEKAAQAGDPQANFTLGSWHCQGRVVEEDWEKVKNSFPQNLTFCSN
jgi:TPR repeat protein